MPQLRDPIVIEMVDILRAAPRNILISPKASQPTRSSGGIQAVQYIDNVSVMNETSAACIVDLGFMVGSHVFWTRTFVCTTAGYWYRNHVHWTLTSDYQVVARFRITSQNGGGTLDDVIHMNINGYYLEPYSSP